MIFISGIHAVGKGYFCGLVKKELGIEAYSASDLIANARNAGFSSDKLVASGLGRFKAERLTELRARALRPCRTQLFQSLRRIPVRIDGNSKALHTSRPKSIAVHTISDAGPDRQAARNLLRPYGTALMV